MEQQQQPPMQPSSSQTPMPGLHPAQVSVNPNSIPQEYWNNLDPLYSGSAPQLQHLHLDQQTPQSQQPQQPQQPQQQQQQQQQQPLGIGWDHPVFQEQQSRGHLQPQEHDHGIYSSTPQSWQPNPLHPHQQLIPPTPEGYGIPQYHHQVQQYPQGQVQFDSRSLSPSDNPAYQHFSIPQNFYPSQHLSVPDNFPQPSPQQNVVQPAPSASYQPASHQAPVAQYTNSAGYPGDPLHNPVNLTNRYHEAPPTVPGHQTINPQFLNTPQQSANQQHPSLHNNFLYVGPADFERHDNSKMFGFYREDLQVPPGVNQHITNQQLPIQTQGAEMVVDNSNRHASAPTKMPLMTGEPLKKKPGPKKKSQPRTKKATSAKAPDGRNGRNSGSSGSETDSSDGSDLEIQMPEEPSPIPPTRPSEPVAAAEYDALQAVWSPRNRRPKVDKVKTALVSFKDVVKNIRDTWKDITQAMKTAENAGDDNKATKLKTDATLQRRLMDVIVSTSLEKGHPLIVEKLGEHPMAVSAMYSFLLDRHQASDVDGTLTVNILQLLARFITMDEDVLQKTNVAKLLPRFVKKGGPTVKELAQKILDNAAAATKRKQENGKPASKEDSPSKSSGPTAATADPSGAKRPREGEANGLPAAKKMVLTSNPKMATKPGVAGNTAAAAKRSQENGQDAKTTAAPASRPKANVVAPRPTNLFGSLSSASKRPGTSNAERAAALAAGKPTGSPDKKEAPAKPAFSFGDIMADLSKPKKPVVTEPTEERPPESEEEREKRLRKESRRKLHVSWKPDHLLTEIREFTHDPEEELGPDDRPSREAAEKGEGRALKLHRDVEDLEEDEDRGVIREEALLDYHQLLEIDDGEITADDRSRNFVKRLGSQQPVSTEKKAQEHREATTLMVFYTSPADVPSTPKEPPVSSNDEIVPDEVAFGELPDHVKARQEHYFAMVNPTPAPAAQPPAPNGQYNITNMLQYIKTPEPQAPMEQLERTIGMFNQQQQQQQVQPQVQPQLAQMSQFPASQPSGTPALDIRKLLDAIGAHNKPVQSQPAVDPNLAAFVSQFANNNQQGGAAQQYEDSERKRVRESNGYDGYEGSGNDGYGQSKRGKFNGPIKKHPKAGMVPCRYWREGKCRKGDDCTFRHDPLN